MKNIIYYTLFAISLLMAQSKVPEEFNEGVKYMEQGEYELAAKYFQDAINKNPKLAPAWFNLAVAYDITGQDSLAIICYQKAAKLDPEDPDPWIYLAQLYQRHDNPRLAIRAYENAISRKPNDAKLLNSLAIAYDQIGRYKDALSAINTAIKIDSEYISAKINKIIILNHMQMYDSAIYSCQKFLKKHRKDPISWTQLAYAYYKKKDYKNASDAIDSALNIYPSLGIAHYYKGLILLKKGNINNAIEEIKTAISLDPYYKSMAINDPELDVLRNNKKFKAMLENVNSEQ